MNQQQQLERGQGMPQYALVIVLVAIVVIPVLWWVGAGTASTFQRVTCVFNRNTCPAAAYSGDNRCTTGEVVQVHLAVCRSGRGTISITSNCVGSTFTMGSTPFVQRTAAIRAELTNVTCTVGSSVPAITSTRPNGTSASLSGIVWQ